MSEPLAPCDWTLTCDAFGRLVLHRDPGASIAVRPVRSFPLSHPAQSLALLGPDGQEEVWIRHLDDLPAENRRLILDDLAQREFNPRIERIRRASGWTTPSRWEVETDRGRTSLNLGSEDDIRRLRGGSLLIADTGGVHFIIPNLLALDKASRRILDHFL